MKLDQIKSSQFTFVTTPEPHRARHSAILKAHPEVKNLFGATPSTSIYIMALVIFQTAMGAAVKNSSLWIILAGAYLVGAVANHALLVLIHDAAHNLVFKKTPANRFAAMIANFPIGFPMSMSFRKYHLLHHREQGDIDYDADLPSNTEARLFGSSTIGKVIWFLVFILIEGAIRPMALKKISFHDRWTYINWVVQAAYVFLVIHLWGWQPYLYLVLSSCFAIGLHPIGARWIQEHYVFRKGQETYSYYGSLNKIAFNVGYHNEHHDFLTIPWARLPDLKRLAPEFYDSLYSHKSWTKLFFNFIFKKENNLFMRVIRSRERVVEAELSTSLTSHF